jgi:hypothetical protein
MNLFRCAIAFAAITLFSACTSPDAHTSFVPFSAGHAVQPLDSGGGMPGGKSETRPSPSPTP